MKTGPIILLFIGIIGVARSKEEKCKCGWKNPSRIVNGVETGINEFPMMARIIYPFPDKYCSATIITPRHVLTVAHCLISFKSAYHLLKVVVGEHDYTKGTTVTKQYSIERVIIHPNYNGQKNDIAIIKTKDRIDYSLRVGPACLPFNYMNQNFTNEIVTAIGWGKLSYKGENSKVLRKVDLHVISTDKCVKPYPSVANLRSICTFDVGKDACKYDSGGPILWRSPTTNNLILVGVIAFGKTCADSYPGVNMKVSSYLDFIRKSTPHESYCISD